VLRVAALLLIATTAPGNPQAAATDCADVQSCRQAALDAAAAGDFEAFHDLAWRAAQKGRRNDPDLMYLVARAQSRSGRPGDALVMLRRLAQMGVATDAGTSPDFERVRRLAGWAEVESLIAEVRARPAAPAAPAEPPRPTRTTGVEPPAGRLAASSAPAPASAKPEAAAAAPPTAEEALRVSGILIEPVGLVYDDVSRRFIVGNRAANKLVVIDEVFNRVTDMVAAASGGFFGLTALEIDRRRGDLWVANSADGAAALHKLQLVSGRVLFAAQLPAESGAARFEALTVTPAGAVLALDSAGRRIFRVKSGTRTFERAAALDLTAPSGIAAADERMAFVSHAGGIARVDLASGTATPLRGASGVSLDGLKRIWWVGGGLVGLQSAGADRLRIVRLPLDRQSGTVLAAQVLAADVSLPDATASAIGRNELYYLTIEDGAPVIRRVRLR
jgi:hypothetical protein